MSKFALLFAGILLAGLGAALFYHGWAAFLLYEITYFMNPDDRWWSSQLPGISYSFWTAILMIVALLFRYVPLTRKSPWTAHPSLLWMIGVLASYYLAYFWALDSYTHERFTFIFMKLVVIVYVAYKLLDGEKALNGAIWAYLLGGTYIAYLATTTGRNVGARLEGISLPNTPDANGVANTLVPAGALLLYFAWMGSKKVRILCIVCGALIANALVLFNSRGAFLGTALSAGLYMVFMMFSKYRQKGQRAMAIVLLGTGIGGGIYVADDVFWDRMSTLQNLESEESGAGRIVFWMTSLEMMGDHPKGLGVRGFNVLAPFYMSLEESAGTRYRSVHSLWFQGLTEIGWHGMFCFLAMLFTLYRLSRRARHLMLEQENYQAYFKILALECGLLGFLITGSFINQFRAEILYWMILLVAVATNVHYLQAVRNDQKAPEGVGGVPSVRQGSVS